MTEAEAEEQLVSWYNSPVVPANYSCVVAAKGGGHGKTLVAQLLHVALARSGIASTLFSIDAPARGDGVSKLKSLYPQTHDIAISAELADVRRDGRVALEHWDGIGDALCASSAVVDLGANIVDTILQWAELSEPRKLPGVKPMSFLVVATASDRSLIDAADLLARIEDCRAVMAIGRIGVVMNEVHGRFDRSRRAVAALCQVAVERDYPIVALPRTVLAAMDLGVSLVRLSTISPKEYQGVRGFEHEGTAWREVFDVREWIERAAKALIEAGFAPAVCKGGGYEQE